MKPNPFKHGKTPLIAALTVMLTACGGGGAGGGSNVAGISGTGITAGPITEFGSIFVNGIRFDIDNADISVNEEGNKRQADLRIGMQVIVTGSVNGNTGVATQVVFDKDIEGPVSNLAIDADNQTMTFNILGTPIKATRVSTTFDDVSFDSLQNDNVVEVSGFADASGNIKATFIEKEANSVSLGSTEVEIKGTVSNVTGIGSFGDSFKINGVNINISGGVEFDDIPGNAVSNGDLVEVEGILTGANTIRATEIEFEDDTPWNNGDDVYLTGIVSEFTNINADFKVGNQVVNAASADLRPASLVIVNGLEVEVEGVVSGGVLFADEVEATEGNIAISGTVTQVNTSGVTLALGDGTIDIVFDSQTELEDDTGATGNLTLAKINNGDFLSIEGAQADDEIVAFEVARIDPSEAVVLAGPVGAVDANTSITVLGITFFVNGGTDYENTSKSFITSASAIGSLIEIEDENKNGFANEIALED